MSATEETRQVDVGAVPFTVVADIMDMHRRELAEMEARVMHYRAMLAEHGIEVADVDDPRLSWNGDEHFAGCREIVRLAYEIVGAVDGFHGSLGTANELLRGSPREGSA